MIYLIHFDKPYKHAQHYLGFVEKDLQQRLDRHLSGQGAKLIKAVNKARIGWNVVRVWEDGDRDFERKLKNRHNTKFLCPICNKKCQSH